MRLGILLEDEVKRSNGKLKIKRVSLEQQPSRKTIINCEREIKAQCDHISHISHYNGPIYKDTLVRRRTKI